MKLWKSSISVLALIILILSSMSVNAESDSTGDVYHLTGTGMNMNWEFYGERDAIDITDVSQSVSDSDITLSLAVKGGITDDQKIFYYVYLQKDATSYYAVHYTQDSGMATGNGDLAGYVDIDPDFSLSSDGKTLSYTFSDIDTGIEYTLWSYAVEHAEYGDIAGESWYDYAPNTKAPYYSGGDDGQTSLSPKTPGFEALAVIAALGIAFIILRRRK